MTRATRRALRLLLALAFAALLAACGTTRKSADRDGPEAKPPPNLNATPDAEPKVEPIRDGGPNKPYEVLGRSYTPVTRDKPMAEKGLASWYGKKFHGKRTASGEVYDMYAMTAAHKTMPLPSYARVRNPVNGREIIVRVNDRGPFHSDRIIDLSYTAALKLGVLGGVAPVEVERLTFEQIRSGSWRKDGVPLPPDTLVPAIDVVARADTAGTGTGIGAAAAGVGAAGVGAAPTLPTVSPSASPTDTTPGASPKPDIAESGFWVQLGAFRQRDGAEQFRRKVADELGWLSPLLAVFSEPSMYRLQAGPYPSRAEAQEAASRVRDALKLVPVVVERR